MLGAFRRFDARTRERIASEREDRADALAHFRHTLKLAEEQVEEVSTVTVPDERTGMPVTRYLFEGETFLREEDAAAVARRQDARHRPRLLHGSSGRAARAAGG